MSSFDYENRPVNLSKDFVGVGVQEISARAYNAVLGGVVLYGIIANILECTYFSNHPIAPENYGKICLAYLIIGILAISVNALVNNTVIRFIAYNALVLPLGVVLSVALQSKGVSIITVNQVFTITAIITFVMISASFVKPELFANLGRVLFICLLGILASIVVELFVGQIILVDYFAAVVFSLYIGYDMYKAQQVPHTVSNAIYFALELYLDIINLFLRLLSIFSSSDD